VVMLRLPTKPDTRKTIDTQAHASSAKGPRVIDDWSRSGDATARPEFDHGLKRKQTKFRKWPY
jgi:hypothetical protein